MTFIVLCVGIPGVAVESRGGDETSSGFDKAPRKERTLADGVAAVLVAQFSRFFGEVEGVANVRVQQHLPGFACKAVHVGVFSALVQLAVAPIDNTEELLSAVDRRFGNALGQTEVGYLEVF